jgi:hypothetical protein
MSTFPPDPAGPFKYDVAISFLAPDLPKARALAARLEPALSVFVYDRHAEELLAADGMERFAEVFRYQSRLHALLYRDGYGKTPWTSFEEGHIKERALHSRFTSLALVKLDASPGPLWVHSNYLYAADKGDDLAEAAAVIRYRAREGGAVLHRPTAAEAAAALARRERLRSERFEILTSQRGLKRAREEVQSLFAAIEAAVSSVGAAVPGVRLACERTMDGDGIYLVSPQCSTTIYWEQPYTNALRDSHLDVREVANTLALPSQSAFRTVPILRRDARLVPYTFDLTDGLEARWRAGAAEGLPSEAFAQAIVSRHVKRYYGSEEARRKSLE